MISKYEQDLASCLLKMTVKGIRQFLSLLVSLVYVISPVTHQKVYMSRKLYNALDCRISSR